jgi:glycosyltransferase involved in cell wall biosynthesis
MQNEERKTAIVTSQFPEVHETFIIRELNALADGGFPMRIYSLKKCRDRIRHPEAQSLEGITTTLAWDSPGVWLQAVVAFFHFPIRALKSLGWVIRYEHGSPMTFAKALTIWMQSLAIARHMKKDGIGHVHAHWATMPTTAAVVIARLLDIPFSFTAHAWDIFVKNPSLQRKVYLAKAVVTCTDFNRNALSEMCPREAGKIFLNYHGVHVAKFAANRASRDEAELPMFLSIGRYVEQKGYADMITAYQSLKTRGIKFRAIIVGEGPLRPEIESQIAAAGLENEVHLTKGMAQQELIELYRQAYAFVLPCVIAENGDRDGIPNVILEAMAAGLPIVSTTVSGVPEAVQNLQTGMAVPPHSPDELANALATLLHDATLTKEMGCRAGQLADEKFSDLTHLPNLVTLMRQIVSPQWRGARLKVAQLIWSLDVGGAERVAVALAENLDRTKYQPMVICQNHEGHLAKQLKDIGVPVIALNKKPGLDFKMLRNLVRVLRQEDVDILHTHLFGASFWGRLAARIAGVRCVVVHEHGMQPWRGSLHFLVDRVLAGAACRFLFASEKVRDTYIEKTGVSVDKCGLVPNGVPCVNENGQREESRAEMGWAGDDRIIVSVGRLSREKGHAYLVRAFADVHATHSDTRLILIGDGPERASLETLVKERQLGAAVFFAGTQDNVSTWLAGADLYVQPSIREGLSLAILEAMGAGLPVVATRVGDVEKIIRDGHSGYLVSPEDSIELSSSMCNVLDNLPDLDALRQAAQKIVRDEYSVEAMVRYVEALYQAEAQRINL